MAEHKPSTQKPRPWERGAEGEATSFGNWLRRQREMREITLREIADTTKVSLRYLEAFEQDRFDVLPATVFAKGFLREYAKYVGLDPDEVVNHFLYAHQSVHSSNEQEQTAESEAQRSQASEAQWPSGLLLGFALVVLLGVIALAALLADRRRGEDEQAPVVLPVAPTPAPLSTPAQELEPAEVPEAAEAERAASLRVTLEFSEECWVEALVDGRRRISELRLQGESLRLDADESVVLTLGNASGVQVEVNGHAVDLGHRAGQVLRDFRIDLDTVRVLGEEAS